MKSKFSLWLLGGILLTALAIPVVAVPLAGWNKLGAARNDEVLLALEISVATSTAVALVALLLGLPLAFVLARSKSAVVRGLGTFFVEAPIFLPPAVLGLGLLIALGPRGIVGSALDSAGIVLPFTTVSVMIAQLVVACPLFVRPLIGAIRDLSPDLEMTAALEGASALTALRKVIAPAVRGSIVSGLALCWSRAMGEFGATLLFAGNLPGKTQTISLAIYSEFQTDIDSAIGLATLSLIILVCVRALIAFVARPKRREAQ
ncbi:MAG: ABC transporter permease subunit [Armatimonadetes bacterium]|nr:ABC transporter permease subunit [Armatimonadota bacterium]